MTKREKPTYDATLDTVIVALGQIPDTDLYADVKAYDGGAPKVSIYRIVGQKKPRTVQVARLPIKDALALAEFIEANGDALTAFTAATE
jgi:hypothetical protein